MPATSRRPSLRLAPRGWLLLAVVAIVGVAITHAVVLSFGLRSDDYMMLRPFSEADVRHVLTGPWGPLGSGQDAYFRPLTTLYLAGLFDIFGLHTWPMHLLSLVELSVVAWLLGLFLWRDLGLKVALIGVVLYLVQPSLPDSTSAWILNQMHLLALIVVAAALLVWQSRRQDPRPVRWIPIFLLTALGVFIKEDTAMILPALLALQWARARFVNDVPGVTTELVMASVLFSAALIGLRAWTFPHFTVDPWTAHLHLIVFSSTLVMAAGIARILAWYPAQRWRRAVAILILFVGLGALARLQRTEFVERFAPCSAEDRQLDQVMRARGLPTEALARWIDLKARACGEGRYQPLALAMDQLHWSRGDDHVLLVHRGAQSISLDLRAAPLDADSETVQVTVDGVTRTLQLRADTRTTVTYRLTDGWRVRWRAAHRIDIDVEPGQAPITLSAVRLAWPVGILSPMGAR